MSCIEANITITSTRKKVQKAFDKFEQKHGRRDNTTTADGPFSVYHSYTPKTFLDAIIKWIVADDQVCVFFFIYVYYLFVSFILVY